MSLRGTAIFWCALWLAVSGAGCSQGSPSSASQATRYLVGGAVSGLAGSGLTLSTSGEPVLMVPSGATSFTFDNALPSGTAYDVVVTTQPSNPAQTCLVANGSGTLASAAVVDIAVTCTTNPPNQYQLGGTISGLAGSGLALSTAGEPILVLPVGVARFTFADAVPPGTGYDVAVIAQPRNPAQTCLVTHGSGTITDADVTDIAVTCTTNPTNQYQLGGTISGLAGSGLTLSTVGEPSLVVPAGATSFTFSQALPSGTPYQVVVSVQPTNPAETCVVANGSGTVAGQAVTNISVSCSAITSTLTPTLVQHVSSNTNIPSIFGDSGRSFTFTLPDPVVAGNALILGLSYASSTSVTSIADSVGNGWPMGPAVATSSGGLASAIFVLTNARGGLTTLTVTLGASVKPFQYTISEFTNLSGDQGSVVGSASNPSYGATPSILSSGSFTPHSNDAGGGNLIWTYLADTAMANGSAAGATAYAAGSGFTLLDANSADGNQGAPHASEFFVQANSAAIDPGVTVTQNGGTDTWNALSVALTAASQGGTNSGMSVVRIAHFSPISNRTPTVFTFPSVGNLLVMTLNNPATNMTINSITDSSGNAWTIPATSGPQVAYAANAIPSPELTISLDAGAAEASVQLWDIAGAAQNPYDAAAGIPAGSDGYSGSGSMLSDDPSITPSAADGLVIASMFLGTGPSSGLASGCPPGSIFDFVYYPGQVDGSNMDNSDGLAHVWVHSTATETWNWMIANGNQGSASGAMAIHFLSAASAAPTPAN